MMGLHVGLRAAAPFFFVLNQRWKQAPGAPLREGGGDPGKPLKQPKKRKKAFSEKRRLLPK